MAAYTTAKLCLVPAGDTPTSRRLFDAMAAGCVPVRVGFGLGVRVRGQGDPKPDPNPNPSPNPNPNPSLSPNPNPNPNQVSSSDLQALHKEAEKNSYHFGKDE